MFALFCLVGYSHKQLAVQTPTTPPEAPAVVNMVALMAGYMISWGNVAGDFCVYMPPSAPKFRVFMYGLLGICTPIILLLTFGAAIGASISNNPTWLAGFEAYSTGGVLGAMLAPAGGFGKFILVLLSFAVVGTCAREIYAVASDFQILIPKAHKVLRFVCVIVTTIIVIGVSEGAIRSFYSSLKNFLFFIGYFSSSYVSIVLLEWWYFRKANAASYDHAIWDNAKELPLGIAGTLAMFLPWALIGEFTLHLICSSLADVGV